jgi:hypothetical protein
MIPEKINKGNFTTQNTKNHIEVIDFYGTHRCVTCKAIEANTRFTLNTYFADELKNGKEKHLDLTDMAFGYGKNKEEFSKRLKAKIVKELKQL